MKVYLFAALLLIVPSMAATAVQPDDFAYGVPLSLEENGAVYRLRVPLEVYQTAARGDLGDIRVFNQAKAVVPYVLQRPEIENTIDEQTVPLPFFPLYVKKEETAGAHLSVRFEKKADGTLLNIHSGGDTAGTDQNVFGYIIDLTANEGQIDALDFTWRMSGESFVSTVSLEHSNDLTNWSNLVRRTTLARMNFRGHQIKKERIQLSSKPLKYIRLLWSKGRDEIEVMRILAVMRRGKAARPYQWKSLAGQPANESEGTDNAITAYEFDGKAQLPVDRIRMRFVEKNTLLEATLLSRSDPDLPWQHRHKGIFYNLNFDGTDLVKDTASVRQTSDRYWRVEVAKGALGDAQNIPIVALGWLPHDLLFTARGQGPFMLAYGSTRLGQNVAKHAVPDLLSQVIGSKEQALVKTATALPRIVLGGPDLLIPAPPPTPWRKWVLWVVLVLGVGVIAWMALSLTRGMNNEAS